MFFCFKWCNSAIKTLILLRLGLFAYETWIILNLGWINSYYGEVIYLNSRNIYIYKKL